MALALNNPLNKENKLDQTKRSVCSQLSNHHLSYILQSISPFNPDSISVNEYKQPQAHSTGAVEEIDCISSEG